MDLVTQGSLRAARFVWMPGHGGFAFTVVCKATFALRPDLSPLAPAQEPVIEADVPAETGSSLALATELVPFKKRPEVILTGQAFAPDGKRVPSFVARLVVGEIDKSAQIAGNRGWGPDGRLGDPAPFARMPLIWERAAGGPGTANPSGRAIGHGARPDAEGRIPAPNLLPAGFQLASRSDVVPPVGFGPIAPFWPSRAACLQRHAAGWDAARWHERPLPSDIDLGYFNAAPPDQQRTQPFGEEVIHLENLHPLFSRLSTRLAPLTPLVTVDRGKGQEVLQLRCDTLLIHTDRGLAMLVWRGHVMMDRPDSPGRVIVSDQKAEQGGKAPGPLRPGPSYDQTQAQGFFEQAASAMPFAEPGGEAAPEVSRAAAPSSRPPAAAEGALLSGATMSVDALFGGTMAFGFANAAPAVPFPAPRGDSAPRSEPPPGGASGLPFAPANAPPAATPGLGTPGLATPGLATPDIVPSAAPAMPAPSDPFGSAPHESPWVRPSAALDRVRPAEGQSPEPVLPPSPTTGEPARPAMAFGMVPVADTAPPAEAPAGDAAATTGDRSDSKVDFDAYPPARCGAIAARLACDPDASGDVLREEKLDAESWERVHEHWQDRIDAEASRGKTRPRADYDRAYVAALEAARIPITLEVYARLVEADERGALDETLEEMRFPEDAWLHLHRSWIPRLIEDPKLGAQIRTAVAALRGAPG